MPALLALTPSPRGLPRCWGYNFYGALGIGNSDTNSYAASLADVDLGDLRTAVQLAAGSYHTCALLDDEQLCVPRPLSLPWMGCFSLA